MTTVTDETGLMKLIASEVEHCNGSLDPGEMATLIVKSLSRQELERLAFKMTRREIVNFVASQRPPTNGGRLARSARWESVAEVADILDQWRVSFTNRPMKTLLDCSPTDLEEAAEWYELRAEGYANRAAAYRKLANTIRRNQVNTPADLPREQVRKILNA